MSCQFFFESNSRTVICQLFFSPRAWDIKIAWGTERSNMLFRQTGLLQLQKKIFLASTIYEDMTVTSKTTQVMTRANVYLHKFKSNKNKHKKQDLTNEKNGKVARNISLVVLWIRMQEITTLLWNIPVAGSERGAPKLQMGCLRLNPGYFYLFWRLRFFFYMLCLVGYDVQ